MPGWFFLILASALALGGYDFCKKCSVQNNRVMPVLFLATLCGTGFLLALSVASGTLAASFRCSWLHWWLILLKSMIVATSWIAGYFALHDLPISIAAPVRASAPVWTVLGGALLLREFPGFAQAVAMLLIFAGYFAFSVIGRTEGFTWRCRGFKMVVAATLLGAASALYDRVLMHTLQLDPNTVQLHFSIDIAVILGLCWLVQPRLRLLHEEGSFQWRWSIPAVGVLLIAADWLFFHAVAQPEAQIGLLSVLRRLSVAVSFFCGALFLHERHIARKAGALVLILAGVALLALVR